MKQLPSRLTIVVVLIVSALLVCAGRTRATEISGTISTTLIIFDDSELTGDVTCAVPLTLVRPNPRIAFAAAHNKLRRNGHSITGPVTHPAECDGPTH